MYGTLLCGLGVGLRATVLLPLGVGFQLPEAHIRSHYESLRPSCMAG